MATFKDSDISGIYTAVLSLAKTLPQKDRRLNVEVKVGGWKSLEDVPPTTSVSEGTVFQVRLLKKSGESWSAILTSSVTFQSGEWSLS
jgi:hypothetical protein